MEQPAFPEEHRPRCELCRLLFRDEKRLAGHRLESLHRRRKKQHQAVLRKWLLGLYGRALGWAAARGVIVLHRHLPKPTIKFIRRFLSVPGEWTAVYFGEKSW